MVLFLPALKRRASPCEPRGSPPPLPPVPQRKEGEAAQQDHPWLRCNRSIGKDGTAVGEAVVHALPLGLAVAPHRSPAWTQGHTRGPAPHLSPVPTPSRPPWRWSLAPSSWLAAPCGEERAFPCLLWPAFLPCPLAPSVGRGGHGVRAPRDTGGSPTLVLLPSRLAGNEFFL